MERSTKSSRPFPSQARCAGGVEASCFISCRARRRPVPKDRGAEGDVDSPLKCRLAFGLAAVEARARVTAETTGSVDWNRRPMEWQRTLVQRTLGTSCSHTAALRTSGTWDHESYLQAFDTANDQIGAARNLPKTEETHYVENLGAAPTEWKIDDPQSPQLPLEVTRSVLL